MAKYKIIPSSRTIVHSPVSIGHKAEKGVQAIEFDLTAWVETYGSGTATVIMRRCGDAIPYPIALEIDENNKATWTLSDTDTAKAGMAYAQLSYIVGETVVKKSDIYTFRVMDSLTGEGDPPEAYESWLEHLQHLAAEAMAEVLDIESIVTDKTLTVDGGIADAKKVGDELSDIKADLDDLDERVDALESGGSGSGLTADIKEALLACFQHVKFQDDNNDYYQDLYDVLYPPVDLVSISAVYTQSGTVYDTDTLDSLKADLVVTAHYSDSTTATVTNYVLSGTLTAGTSTITVSYGGKTTTFYVTVTAAPTLTSISAVYTQSGTVYDTDTLDSLKSSLVVTAAYSDSTTRTLSDSDYTLSGTLEVGTSTITVSYGGKTTTFNVTVTEAPASMLYNWDFTESLTDTVEGVTVTSATNREPTRDSTGLVFSEALQQITVPVSIDMSGKTIELDIASAEFNGNTSYHSRIIMLNGAQAATDGFGLLLWRSTGVLSAYGITVSTGTSRGWGSAWSSELSGSASDMFDLLSGKTVKIVCDSDGHTMDIYLDGVHKGTIDNIYFGNSQMRYLHLGGLMSGEQSSGNQCYNMTITGMRIYPNAAEGDSE